MIINSQSANKVLLITLAVFFFVVLACLFSLSTAWPTIPKVDFGGAVDAVKKAGGDVSDTVKKAGGDVSNTIKKAGGDISDEWRRIPGNLNAENRNIVQAADRARDVVTQELRKMPTMSDLSQVTRMNTEKYLKTQLDQLKRAFPVPREVLEQRLRLAIGNLIPGVNTARYAAIITSIAQAADDFYLTNAHANNLVNKVKGWPRNQENLRPYCQGMQTHSEKMFAPFISGPQAEFMSLKPSVLKIRDPVRKMINSICDAVYQGQDVADQGQKLETITIDSVRTTILKEMNDRLRAEFQNALTELIIAVTAPF